MWTSQSSTVGSRLARGGAAIIPALVCAFCVVATVLPYGSFGGITLAPIFPRAAIYFFVLTRPDQITPFVILLVGVLHDLLSGSPLGLWALVYLSAYGLTAALRIVFVGQTASGAWPGFILVAVSAGVAIWILASLFFGTVVAVVPVVVQMMFTAALYPVLAWVFTFFLAGEEV